MNETDSPKEVSRYPGNLLFVKTLCLFVGVTLVFGVSPAGAKDPRSQGLQLPPGVEDPRPCPEGTTRVVEFGGPCFEQLCLKSDLLGIPIIHGPAVAWYKNKQKYVEGTYHEGKPHGAWTFWHESGHKERQGMYRDGQPEGRWTLWDPEGRKVEVEFHNGEAVRFSPSLEAALAVKGFALRYGGSGETEPLLYWGKEIQGQVVDAVTRQPIVGAVVVAKWEIHVERRVNPGNARLHISEARTDENGRYLIPEWRKLRPPLTSLSTDPTLVIFKSGYRPHVVVTDTVGRPYQLPESDWLGKTIKLERIRGTVEEQASDLSRAYRGLSTNRAEDEPNDWKRFPRATLEVHKEAHRLLALGLNPRRGINVIDIDRLGESDQEFLRRFEK